MIFIIGGSDQGKRAFARENPRPFGGRLPDLQRGHSRNRFPLPLHRAHRAVCARLRAAVERCVEDYWRAHLDRLGDKVLIADDISCGIVPVDPTMRAWREASGRANALLANRAERVWRVFCGLGQVIK